MRGILVDMDANNPDFLLDSPGGALRAGDVVRLGADHDKLGMLVLHVFAERTRIANIRIPRINQGQVAA